MASKPVSGVMPNLVNGVSQQAPALRLPSQSELQDNYYPTIVEGLKDRPPTEFVAKIVNSLPASVFTHIINRDVTERYVVTSDGTSIQVTDFTGVAKTVNAPGGYGYFDGVTTPAEDIIALTVADYTFIVNKKKIIAMDTATSPTRNHEALVNVIQGNYAHTYSIVINGVTASTFTTSATTASDLDTSHIATQLVANAVAPYNAAPWHFVRYQNAVHIYKDDGTDFTITSEDGFNGNAMKAVKDRTQHFSDLPYFGPDGFVTEILGDENNGFDNYWVVMQTSGSGPGVWKETLKAGIKLNLDATTMPHTLVREADGSFTFDTQTWDPRKCGDGDKISPDPSFVGFGVNDIFFNRDRLGLLSDQNQIMSRTGSFFDFFRTSATALLDDDPIDIGASHTKVSILQHAVPYQKELLVFSDQTQFLSAGTQQTLTPKNVSIDPLTEYVSDPAVKPVGLGLSVFFAAKRGDWSAVWEYTIGNYTGQPIGDASETTDDVPSYIPAGLFKLAGTSNESILVGLTTGDASALYVYKFLYQQDKKLQSAWSRFPLYGATAILNAEFVNSDLYLVVERSGGVYLEKMRLSPAVSDTDLGFLVHLDQRVHTDQLAAPTYDAATDTTTYTLPYMPDGTIVAVTSSGNVDVLPALELKVAGTSGSTVSVAGDVRTYPIWFGYTYERRYRFSTFFVRQPNGSGGSITVQRGRLQVVDLTVAYNKTSYFRLEVTPKGREMRTYSFTGREIGDPEDLLGVVPIVGGKKTFPILSRNDRVTIDIVNDSWMPSAFVNALWTGRHASNVKDF